MSVGDPAGTSVRPGDAAIPDAIEDWLKRNGSQVILIEGHCDDRGTSEYKMALGKRRARVAADYLIGKGIAASRLLLISYGKERPFARRRPRRAAPPTGVAPSS